MIVRTQTEFDTALARGAPWIEINSDPTEWITIGDTRVSFVTVAGKSRVTDCSGHISKIADRGRVDRISGSGRVDWITDHGTAGGISDEGSVGNVYDFGCVIGVTDGGRVDRVRNSGHIGEVTGNGRVDTISGTACVDSVTGNGRVAEVTGNARIRWVTGFGRVDHVTDCGRVDYVAENGCIREVTGNGRVGNVSENGRVEWVTDYGVLERVADFGCVDRASGAASVHLHDDASLRLAGSYVTVYLHDPTVTHRGGHPVDLTAVDRTAPDWCAYHDVDVADGFVTVYAAVDGDYRSTRRELHRVGREVTCDDWSVGLHFAATPAPAGRYHHAARHYMECRVALDDIRPIRVGGARCTAPRAQVVREVDIRGQPIPQEVKPIGLS